MADQRTTTQRGYGWAHVRARKAALNLLQPGEPCHYCGRPMYRHQPLDYDHTTDRHAYRGLTHAQCNRAAGGRLARARERARRHHPRTPPRTW